VPLHKLRNKSCFDEILEKEEKVSADLIQVLPLVCLFSAKEFRPTNLHPKVVMGTVTCITWKPAFNY